MPSSLPSPLPADEIPSIAPVAPPPAPAPGASVEAFPPSGSPIQSASIQPSSPEPPTTSNTSPPRQSSPTSTIIRTTTTSRALAPPGMPPPAQSSISAVSTPSTTQTQLSTTVISLLVTFGIVIIVTAAAFVAVYKRKLSRDAKQKKRQIPKTLGPSVSNEYLGDNERLVARGRASVASSVDVPSIEGNHVSNVHPTAMSSDGVFFWPFAAKADTEEDEPTSPTRDGATTAVDTGGNTSHYYTDTQDSAMTKKRVPSFELLPGGVHAAASDEAFSYYGFGASRLPRLNPLEPQGVVIVNEPFEMEDGFGGVAYMTDSGDMNHLGDEFRGQQSQRNVSTRSSREHRFNSSSPSSIVKSLSANVSVEGHHTLSRKTSMQAEIWDA
ncbi:hypothetical protein HDU81_002496 [Chytriomyces hyalinus]|nr:hypothetical protein HDU81_002496 [Chytriomyces hyalinus]